MTITSEVFHRTERLTNSTGKNQTNSRDCFKRGKTAKGMFVRIIFSVVTACFLSGCETSHITLAEASKPESLEPIRTPRSIPVKIQVANFTVDSVECKTGGIDEVTMRKHLELTVPNRIFFSLGNRHVFSEVSRIASTNEASADFVVSGEYEFIYRLGGGVISAAHAYVKGTTHLHVIDAKTGNAILEKTYVEEHGDKSTNPLLSNHSFPLRPKVQGLQDAHIADITTDIKKAIFQKIGTTP